MHENEESELRGKGRLILFGAAIGVLAMVMALIIFTNVWPHSLAPNKMNYQDLISIILTALAVLIAVLGALVAVAALWGYAAFERLAKDAARKCVTNDIKKGTLRKHMEKLVMEYLKQESADGGMFRQILIDEANRIAMAGKDRSGQIQNNTTDADDEDEGQA